MRVYSCVLCLLPLIICACRAFSSYEGLSTKLPFSTFGLYRPILEGLRSLKLHNATGVQAKVLDHFLDPLFALSGDRDAIISAPTGSGKTLSYLIPIMQRLCSTRSSRSSQAVVEEHSGRHTSSTTPGVFIVLPNRELCSQVHNIALHFIRHGLNATVNALWGHYDIWPFKSSHDVPNILITTPHFFSHFTSGGAVKNIEPFMHIDSIVFDEADHIFAGSHQQDMLNIVNVVNRNKKKLCNTRLVFVAATIPHNGPKSFGAYLQRNFATATVLNTDFLHQPLPHISQEFIPLESTLSQVQSKQLVALLKDNIFSHATTGKKKVIIFTDNVASVKMISGYLSECQIRTFQCHAQVRQDDRITIIEAFRQSDSIVCVLVATDLASRGLDFPDVTDIVQFPISTSMLSYLHRIGRTGRGLHSSGNVWSFYDPNGSSVELVEQAKQVATEKISDKKQLLVELFFSRNRSLRKRIRKETK